MNRQHLALLLLAGSLSLTAQAPAGWKTLKAAKGDCQLSVPADWTITAGLANMASAPANLGQADVAFLAGKSLMQLNEASQKALSVDKMLENSSKLVLYAVKPGSQANPLTPYFAKAPGSGGLCAANIAVRPGISEETVKKIASTLH